jgi:hypothetical protein
MKCVFYQAEPGGTFPDLWLGLDQAEPGGTYSRPVVGIGPGRAWWYVFPTCGRDWTRQSLVVRIPDLWLGLDQAKPGGTYP